YHCVAAEYRSPGVDHHTILDRRMPLLPANQSALFILWKRQGSKSHALIEFDVVSDHRRFADNHSRAVIYEETISDLGSGMNVDAGSRMCKLGEHAGQKRHSHTV